MNSIFHRTSVRSYLPRPVEQEKVEQLLRAAMAAPSAGNQQPWSFYVVTDPAVMEALAGCSPYAGCVKAAPLVIVPCYREAICRHPEFAQIDLSASVENLLLEADALGLGAVWLGIAPRTERMAAVGEVLHLPEGETAFALIPCGYPAAAPRAQEDRFDQSRVRYVK
ncbi:MAG: nitroreductase family protein [Clostridiales bacterium]|nr:nitroreductase family protein [Clostridiales bacterium]